MSANNICQTHNAAERAMYCEVEILGEAIVQPIKISHE